MRVIAGTVGGRRLRAPRGDRTRPTSDRVREALFASLGPRVRGARVLDLYAGSGAMGIEALSRGADSAVFVESAPAALRAIRDNLDGLAMGDRTKVLGLTAERACAGDIDVPVDLVLIDPPYDVVLGSVYDALADLHRRGMLAPGAQVVIERSRRDPQLEDTPPRFLASDRIRTYGDTALSYLTADDGD